MNENNRTNFKYHIWLGTVQIASFLHSNDRDVSLKALNAEYYKKGVNDLKFTRVYRHE